MGADALFELALGGRAEAGPVVVAVAGLERSGRYGFAQRKSLRLARGILRSGAGASPCRVRRGRTSPAHDGLLRSINVAFDASYPERVAHFGPTSKSVRYCRHCLVSLPQRAFLITAPYGSGKSLVAAYALQVIENNELASRCP